MRRIKWVTIYLLLLTGLYLFPYTKDNSNYTQLALLSSIFFAIASHQIIGNYNNFNEYIDSVIKAKRLTQLSIMSCIVVSIVIFFVLDIHHENKKQDELLSFGYVIKAHVEDIESELIPSKGGRSYVNYYLIYSYTVNGRLYENKCTSNMEENFHDREIDSIEIVVSRLHPDLSRAKRDIYK